MALQFTPKRKLSSRDIVGEDVRVIWRRAKKADPLLMKIDLYKITGMASRYDTVPSPYGESLRLIGDFIAINVQTGEVLRSNRCFLPGIMQDAIVAGISGVGSGDAVQFAYMVSITDDSDNVKNATGYIYTFETLMEMKESNQMVQLAGVIGVKNVAVAQLPPPELTVTKQIESNAKGKGK